MARTYAVIMAGGSGTRFWPASRRARPKQLLPLAGDTPLLRQAVERVVPLCGWANVRIATGKALVDATLAVLPELSRAQLLVEPVPRNTAPCLGWAAARIARSDPEAVIMALPSDPYIADEAGFAAVVEKACDSARRGVITTIGIKPTRAETGYGYIEAHGEGDVLAVSRFVEKPDLARAEAFLRDGSYYWNAGMFFYRACDMLEAISTHLPSLAAGLDRLDAAARRGEEEAELASTFPALPAISIDHGVMEHVATMAMVRGDFGWSDLGSWLAVAELSHADDAAGNSATVPDGVRALWIDARENHVHDLRTGGDKRAIALVGVSNLVVVQTDDALLVVERDRAQNVRDIVAQLSAQGDDDLT